MKGIKEEKRTQENDTSWPESAIDDFKVAFRNGLLNN
jgi:hypothetical protein